MLICQLNRNQVVLIILQVYNQATSFSMHIFKMQFTYIVIFLLQAFLRILKEFYFCFLIGEE